MTKGRLFLIAAQATATLLFVTDFDRARHWSAWLIPMVLIVLMVINSLRFTRFVSWVIFSVAFASLMIVLSAFTMRWRLEPGFGPIPFYRAMGMYVAFVYVSLAQIKLLGGGPPADKKLEEK